MIRLKARFGMVTIRIACLSIPTLLSLFMIRLRFGTDVRVGFTISMPHRRPSLLTLLIRLRRRRATNMLSSAYRGRLPN